MRWEKDMCLSVQYYGFLFVHSFYLFGLAIVCLVRAREERIKMKLIFFNKVIHNFFLLKILFSLEVVVHAWNDETIQFVLTFFCQAQIFFTLSLYIPLCMFLCYFYDSKWEFNESMNFLHCAHEFWHFDVLNFCICKIEWDCVFHFIFGDGSHQRNFNDFPFIHSFCNLDRWQITSSISDFLCVEMRIILKSKFNNKFQALCLCLYQNKRSGGDKIFSISSISARYSNKKSSRESEARIISMEMRMSMSGYVYSTHNNISRCVFNFGHAIIFCIKSKYLWIA